MFIGKVVDLCDGRTEAERFFRYRGQAMKARRWKMALRFFILHTVLLILVMAVGIHGKGHGGWGGMIAFTLLWTTYLPGDLVFPSLFEFAKNAGSDAATILRLFVVGGAYYASVGWLLAFLGEGLGRRVDGGEASKPEGISRQGRRREMSKPGGMSRWTKGREASKPEELGERGEEGEVGKPPDDH
jgi:hypothetical protein